jgi:hypothetical protein
MSTLSSKVKQLLVNEGFVEIVVQDVEKGMAITFKTKGSEKRLGFLLDKNKGRYCFTLNQELRYKVDTLKEGISLVTLAAKDSNS